MQSKTGLEICHFINAERTGPPSGDPARAALGNVASPGNRFVTGMFGGGAH